MMLTKAKCPACGGALELNPGLERGICVYCGSEFLVQEAIQKFKAEIDGLPTLKNMLIRAEQKLSDGDLKGAEALYEEILKGAPTCHEAWWGKFRSLLEGGYLPIRLVDCQHRVISLIKEGFIENAKKELKDIVAALDRADLQYLFGNNTTNALRAIEYAPEELKGVYQQKLDQILKDCKKISEDMKKLLTAREEELRKASIQEKKAVFLLVLGAILGGIMGYFWRGVIFGFILGMLWASETMKVKMIFLIILGTILVGGIMGYFWTGVIFGFIFGFILEVIREGRNEKRSADATTTDASLSSQTQ